ncbi:MAG: sugar phosphate isomerase/epimerase family protein [Promethearchaeota archaeon]
MRPDIILAVRLGSYGKYTLFGYEHLSEIGVTYLEHPVPTDDGGIEMLKEILDDFNLKISSFQVSFTPLDERKFNGQIELLFEMNKNFGTKVFFTSLKAPEKGKKRARFFEKLRYMGDQIKEKGLKVCLETHPNLVTNGKIGKETMETINHESIRINFDTANMYYYNKGIDLLEELNHILNFVGSVHLKDTNGKYKSWYFPALGEGIVDFPEVIKKLNSVQFKGPYTLEIEGCEGESLTLEQTKDRIQKSVEYIKQYL